MPASLVILWWGADIRILGENGRMAARVLEEREDPVAAILKMIGENFSAARTVRIIYHPDTLDVHEVPCPLASRVRLRRIFAGEFRALDNPGAVWSLESVRRGLNGYGTVLYIDSRSRLPRLLAGLSERGLLAEGVWPLQSLVEITPPGDAGEDGFLSLVATANRALVSCAGLSGDRSVRFCDGREFADAAIAEIRSARARFAENATPPLLLMLEEGPHAGALREALGAPSPAGMPLAEFLHRARFLPAGGFSDFIPHRPFWARLLAPRRTLALAGMLLLAGSAGCAWLTRQDQERAQRQIAAGREQHLHLRQLVADRTALDAERDRLTQALIRVESRPQLHFEFLTAVARATPKAIALQTVTIRDGFFTLQGHIYDGADRADSPLTVFYRELSPPAAPWHLREAPATTADFVLRGSFDQK